jgi:hypothetical protein
MAPPTIEELLKGLSEEQRKEALAAAAAAARAEEKAEQRVLQRAMEQKQKERELEKAAAATKLLTSNNNGNKTINDRVVYVPKRKRGQTAPENIETVALKTHLPPVSSNGASKHVDGPKLTEKELTAVKQTYLGKQAVPLKEPPKKKPQGKKGRVFKFQWDNSEDTFETDDLLYTGLQTTGQYRNKDHRHDAKDIVTARSVAQKPLDKMTSRDWRIVRENYQITVKGGKAPPPMRSFHEPPLGIPPLHPALLEAIELEFKFAEPSPIQRQAIPIGLQRRDLIGIAETGSGKTVAFGVPLCQYLLQLPQRVLVTVADSGPLGLVMAPTRELSQQIEREFVRLLSRQNQIKTVCIVGGQPIQQQAVVLRQGVHVVIGTPGRINECIDMAYLVLNQCSYVVLDEADRMVDM